MTKHADINVAIKPIDIKFIDEIIFYYLSFDSTCG
jgi:hypothetical protein